MSKIAIITGATGNLGKAVTKKMVSDGYTVIGTTEPGKNEPEQEHVHYEAVDLMDEAAADEFIKKVHKEHGGIDALVCLVGGFGMASLPDTKHADLEKMIRLNFYTAFNTLQPALNVMKDQKNLAKIILVGAKPVFEVQAFKALFPYALSKSMVINMAAVINADWQKHNATATVVVPSIIDTPPNREGMPDANFDDWVTPESIAEKIVFVCSDAGRDLRETVLKVYGNS